MKGLLALLAALLGAGCGEGSAGVVAEPSAALRGEVVFVPDGDTVHVEASGRREKVRLIGIDAPEAGECGYRGASKALRRMVDGRTVRLVSDPLAGRRDRFGRMLAYVEVGERDAGEEQVRAGRARVFVVGRGFRREARYRRAAGGAPDRCG